MHSIPSIIQISLIEEHSSESDFQWIVGDYSVVNNPLGFLNYHHFLNYFIDFHNINFMPGPKIASNVITFACFSSYFEGFCKDFDPIQNSNHLTLSLRQNKLLPQKCYGFKSGWESLSLKFEA